MRKQPVPAAIAAALAAKARRPTEAAIPLYLPAYGDCFEALPDAVDEDDEDLAVDASGITIGGDLDDDYDF